MAISLSNGVHWWTLRDIDVSQGSAGLMEEPLGLSIYSVLESMGMKAQEGQAYRFHFDPVAA